MTAPPRVCDRCSKTPARWHLIDSTIIDSCENCSEVLKAGVNAILKEFNHETT
jgi:hypothetical protein